ILSTLGIPVGVVGWPLTYPAPAVRGFLVSDQYPRLIATPSGVNDSTAVYPQDIQDDALRAAEAAAAETDPAVQSAHLDRRYEAPSKTDRADDRIGRELGRTRPVQIS